MRRAYALVIAIVSVVTVVAAPAPAALRPGELGSAEAILKWINGYRGNRDAASVPAVVKALSQLGAFKDPENAGVYVGFMAGVIGTNPDKASELVAKMLPIAPEDHWAIVRAVAYSSHPDWKGLLRRFADRMPTRRRMIEQYLAGRLPVLTELDFSEPPGTLDKVKDALRVTRYFGEPPPRKVELEPSPLVLDTLWGYYFGTGAYGPIARIELMLPWSKDKNDVEKLTIGSMAKYTLATNASRDTKLLFILKASMKHQPGTVVPILTEVIEAAETVETAKIRKEALAAVEELKRKGPASRRTAALWAQIGEGSVAVGCIAAAALGAVAVGIPCVVGGAVSSAGLRYLSTSQ